MKHLTSIIALVCASSFAATNSHAQTTTKTHTINEFYQYVGPDIDFQGGVGFHWEINNVDQNTVLGMGRVRLGLLYFPGYPWAIAGGPTFEINTTTNPVWGLQAEVLNMGAGLWFRGGGGMDYNARYHYNMALGWSIVGIEINGFGLGYDNRSGTSVIATLRIPVGYIIYIINKMH